MEKFEGGDSQHTVVSKKVHHNATAIQYNRVISLSMIVPKVPSGFSIDY